ncbi:hypothetical protein FRB96_002250 [Tulasnella sp. 330]|nr:hypothetical protein FRB96_002250 [Tulasnella sp. 330]
MSRPNMEPGSATHPIAIECEESPVGGPPSGSAPITTATGPTTHDATSNQSRTVPNPPPKSSQVSMPIGLTTELNSLLTKGVHTFASQVIAIHAQHPVTSATLPPNIAAHMVTLSNENRHAITQLGAIKALSEEKEKDLAQHQQQLAALTSQYKKLAESYQGLGDSWNAYRAANELYRKVKEEDVALLKRLSDELASSNNSLVACRAELDAYRAVVSEWQKRAKELDTEKEETMKLKNACVETMEELKKWKKTNGELARMVHARDSELIVMRNKEQIYIERIQALEAQHNLQSPATASSSQHTTPTLIQQSELTLSTQIVDNELQSSVVQRPLPTLSDGCQVRRPSHPNAAPSSSANTINMQPSSLPQYPFPRPISTRHTNTPINLPSDKQKRQSLPSTPLYGSSPPTVAFALPITLTEPRSPPHRTAQGVMSTGPTASPVMHPPAQPLPPSTTRTYTPSQATLSASTPSPMISDIRPSFKSQQQPSEPATSSQHPATSTSDPQPPPSSPRSQPMQPTQLPAALGTLVIPSVTTNFRLSRPVSQTLVPSETGPCNAIIPGPTALHRKIAPEPGPTIGAGNQAPLALSLGSKASHYLKHNDPGRDLPLRMSTPSPQLNAVSNSHEILAATSVDQPSTSDGDTPRDCRSDLGHASVLITVGVEETGASSAESVQAPMSALESTKTLKRSSRDDEVPQPRVKLDGSERASPAKKMRMREEINTASRGGGDVDMTSDGSIPPTTVVQETDLVGGIAPSLNMSLAASANAVSLNSTDSNGTQPISGQVFVLRGPRMTRISQPKLARQDLQTGPPGDRQPSTIIIPASSNPSLAIETQSSGIPRHIRTSTSFTTSANQISGSCSASNLCLPGPIPGKGVITSSKMVATAAIACGDIPMTGQLDATDDKGMDMLDFDDVIDMDLGEASPSGPQLGASQYAEQIHPKKRNKGNTGEEAQPNENAVADTNEVAVVQEFSSRPANEVSSKSDILENVKDTRGATPVCSISTPRPSSIAQVAFSDASVSGAASSTARPLTRNSGTSRGGSEQGKTPSADNQPKGLGKASTRAVFEPRDTRTSASKAPYTIERQPRQGRQRLLWNASDSDIPTSPSSALNIEAHSDNLTLLGSKGLDSKGKQPIGGALPLESYDRAIAPGIEETEEGEIVAVRGEARMELEVEVEMELGEINALTPEMKQKVQDTATDQSFPLGASSPVILSVKASRRVNRTVSVVSEGTSGDLSTHPVSASTDKPSPPPHERAREARAIESPNVHPKMDIVLSSDAPPVSESSEASPVLQPAAKPSDPGATPTTYTSALAPPTASRLVFGEDKTVSHPLQSESTLTTIADEAEVQLNVVDEAHEDENAESAFLAAVFVVKDEEKCVLQCDLCLHTFKEERLFTVNSKDSSPLGALVDHCKTVHKAAYARALQLQAE